MKIELSKIVEDQFIVLIETGNTHDPLEAIIKRFSRQTKTYPPMEWWEFAG
jgi:hypothetical protein